MVILKSFLANVPILQPLEPPEISGNLMVKSKLSLCSGSVALRKKNLIKRGLKDFLGFKSKVSGVFMGSKMGTLTRNGLKVLTWLTNIFVFPEMQMIY